MPPKDSTAADLCRLEKSVAVNTSGIRRLATEISDLKKAIALLNQGLQTLLADRASNTTTHLQIRRSFTNSSSHDSDSGQVSSGEIDSSPVFSSSDMTAIVPNQSFHVLKSNLSIYYNETVNEKFLITNSDCVRFHDEINVSEETGVQSKGGLLDPSRHAQQMFDQMLKRVIGQHRRVKIWGIDYVCLLFEENHTLKKKADCIPIIFGGTVGRWIQVFTCVVTLKGRMAQRETAYQAVNIMSLVSDRVFITPICSNLFTLYSKPRDMVMIMNWFSIRKGHSSLEVCRNSNNNDSVYLGFILFPAGVRECKLDVIQGCVYRLIGWIVCVCGLLNNIFPTHQLFSSSVVALHQVKVAEISVSSVAKFIGLNEASCMKLSSKCLFQYFGLNSSYAQSKKYFQALDAFLFLLVKYEIAVVVSTWVFAQV